MKDGIEIKVIKRPNFDLLIQNGKRNLGYMAEQLAYRGAKALRESAPRASGRLAGSAIYTRQVGILSYHYTALNTGESFSGSLQTRVGEQNVLASYGVSTPYAEYVERYHPDYWQYSMAAVQARLNNLKRNMKIFETESGGFLSKF